MSEAELRQLICQIPKLSTEIRPEILAAIDNKTKPRESLGRIESLALALGLMQGRVDPKLERKTVVIMAADHGVATQGVSAYPPEVTAQMMMNFANGGAAINVFSRQVGARVKLVDMGIAGELPVLPSVESRRIAAGTADLTTGPAMSIPQCLTAMWAGAQLAAAIDQEGCDIVCLGEMGIGNTTSATLIASHFLEVDPATIVGRGTGIDEAGLSRKLTAIRASLEVNRGRANEGAIAALACYGGFEIAGLAGLILGAARRRIPVLVDGFITSAAALAAVRVAATFNPAIAHGPDLRMLASHVSVEPGHAKILDALRLEALFDLKLRLGEGTGAALALPLLEAATRMLAEMATFESAAVSDSGA